MTVQDDRLGGGSSVLIAIVCQRYKLLAISLAEKPENRKCRGQRMEVRALNNALPLQEPWTSKAEYIIPVQPGPTLSSSTAKGYFLGSLPARQGVASFFEGGKRAGNTETDGASWMRIRPRGRNERARGEGVPEWRLLPPFKI